MNEYVETARRHNAVPVLLTPVRKREFAKEIRDRELPLADKIRVGVVANA